MSALLALRGAVFAAALASAGCATAQDHAPEPRPAWDYVEFEVKSWGSTVSSWRILPDGGGSWTEALREQGQAPSVPASLAWHEITADAANFETLAAILHRLPDPAPDSQACENFMTDAPYGTLRLTRGATTTEIAWNSGCMDENYRAFMTVLKAADEHMAALGKAAPVARTDPPQ
ncbi:hypothetical protein [Qipengyuania zhejiangensis]|uniref:hypothetical protein n=1 Tax=Qipengyuania zhejiangensis TaxID=3077782 RepID=UPI002D78D7F1|nr:hypothetical protein [Qipengyuania sp. Z2]